MKKILFALLTCFCCPTAEATAMMEGNRLQMQIVYDKDISAKMICPRDIERDCRIDIVFHGKRYRITQAMIGKKYPMYPGELRISYNTGTDSPNFVVSFEIGCAEYSDAQPSYICGAGIYMEDGRPKNLSIHKRQDTVSRTIETIDLSRPEELSQK